jgi:dodecin
MHAVLGARVSEITVISTKSFEDAITQGLMRTTNALSDVHSAWIMEQQARVVDDSVTEYQVHLLVTFVAEE